MEKETPSVPEQDEYIDEYYMAYATNLNMCRMHVLCPGARLVDTFLLPDYRLAFRGQKPGSSYLTLVHAMGSSVPVALWKVSLKDKLNLDKAVHVNTGLYEMVAIVVGHKPCFTYLLHPHFPYVKPSEDYVECVKEGYKDMGFDKLHIKCAYE